VSGEGRQCRKPNSFKLAMMVLGMCILGLLAVGLSKCVGRIHGSVVEACYIFVLLALGSLVLGIFAIMNIRRRTFGVISVTLAILGTGFAVVMFILAGLRVGRHLNHYLAGIPGRICSTNLRVLEKAIKIYANDYDDQYPTADKWCDLLIAYLEVSPKQLVCKGSDVKIGESSYAFNKNLIGKRPTEVPPDVVVLFETNFGKNPAGREEKLGSRYFYQLVDLSYDYTRRIKKYSKSRKVYKLRWNQFGGPEILTIENHNGQGCFILFNDGRVEFVKPERLGELKWEIEEEEKNGSWNFRKPGSDEELKYWLKNMVWFHRFTNEEIHAATGLTNEEIVAALKKFEIRADNRPKRGEDASLLVLPYPGGRHPRIGFLEGAIDPQRETKFSVFTPWDRDSYVVVDLPEAIWSNLGLTYLAHRHIDTIWTKKGIELSKLEWNRHPDGTLDIVRELPNGIVFGVKVKPQRHAVRMEMWLKNGTDKRLSDLRVQICVMTKMAAGFEQETNDNKMFTNPYVACRSSDGKRWIITAWEGCHRPWGNESCPCFHSDPKFPDLEPGQAHRLRGWLSFYEGTDIEAEFKRIEETGWREK